MYHAIGFLVVAGFALFGASKFIEDHVVLDVKNNSDADRGDARIRHLHVVINQDPSIPDSV